MKESHNWYRRTASKSGVAAIVLLALAIPCLARPTHVPNQLIVTMKPGYGDSDMHSLARTNNISVKKALPLRNTYLVQMNRAETVESKINKMKRDRRIASVSPNYCSYPTASVPNDARYSEQWAAPMMNMPQAWDIEKGNASVTVAVIDTGISLTHPDITARLVAGRDTGDDDDNPGFPPNAQASGSAHGLHVAGIIAATTNNALGVAGVCWEGVKIMPIKAIPDAGYESDDTLYFSHADLIEALDWAKTHGADVVNMSLGGGMYDPAYDAKIQELINAGIVVVASAGNGYGPPVEYPAAFDGVIAVAAVNRAGTLSYYSSYGPEVSVAAPGGEMFGDGDPGGILSLWWTAAGGDGYAFEQGTSMASPEVAGAAAILLSFGVAPSEVKKRLELSAKEPAGMNAPNDMYGWGVIDVFAALSLGGAAAEVLSPTNGQKIDTKLPHFQVKFTNAGNVRQDSILVYLGINSDADGDGIPDDATNPVIDSSNVAGYYNSTTGVLDFQVVVRDPSAPDQSLDYPVTARNPVLIDQPFEPGTYRISIKASSLYGASTPTTSWSTFRIEPRNQPAGLCLASVPYPLIKQSSDARTATQMFFGTNSYRMARWLPSLGVYARQNYPGVINDVRGSLFPPDVDAHPHTTTGATPPAGVGFWLQMGSVTPLLADTFVDYLDAYDIPVVAGWNMIGDPFPFKVDWNAVMVSYQGRTLTISDAVAAGWLRPALYRYSPAGYTYVSLPGGTLIPWEGNWIKCLKGTAAEPFVDTNLNGVRDSTENYTDRNGNGKYDPADPVVLSIPPVASQVVTNNSVRTNSFVLTSDAANRDEWGIRLAVAAGAFRSGYQAIGVRNNARDTYDAFDVEAPPSPAGYVRLAFTHSDWGVDSGSYSTDIRSSVGREKVWRFQVDTDQPNTDVRIAWPGMESAPKDCLLTLVDCESGKKVSLRTADSYVYRSGAKATTRHFKLYVRPAGSTRTAMRPATGSYKVAANR